MPNFYNSVPNESDEQRSLRIQAIKATSDEKARIEHVEAGAITLESIRKKLSMPLTGGAKKLLRELDD